MATVNGIHRSHHGTLTGTDVEIVNFDQVWDWYEVSNHDATDVIYYRLDGTSPVAAAESTMRVGPGQSLAIQGKGSQQVRLIGDGGAYSVMGA